MEVDNPRVVERWASNGDIVHVLHIVHVVHVVGAQHRCGLPSY
jgi:hypothetical protein